MGSDGYAATTSESVEAVRTVVGEALDRSADWAALAVRGPALPGRPAGARRRGPRAGRGGRPAPGDRCPCGAPAGVGDALLRGRSPSRPRQPGAARPGAARRGRRRHDPHPRAARGRRRHPERPGTTYRDGRVTGRKIGVTVRRQRRPAAGSRAARRGGRRGAGRPEGARASRCSSPARRAGWPRTPSSSRMPPPTCWAARPPGSCASTRSPGSASPPRVWSPAPAT